MKKAIFLFAMALFSAALIAQPTVSGPTKVLAGVSERWDITSDCGLDTDIYPNSAGWSNETFDFCYYIGTPSQVGATYIVAEKVYDPPTYYPIEVFSDHPSMLGPKVISTSTPTAYSLPQGYDSYSWTISNANGATGTIVSGAGTYSVTISSGTTGVVTLRCTATVNGDDADEAFRYILVN